MTTSGRFWVTAEAFGDAPVAALAPNVGTVVNTGGVNTDYPYQLALDGAGNIYVGNYVQDGSSPKVVKIPAGGGTASAVSVSGISPGLGISICGVAVDGAGNLFIADYYNDRIVVVTPAGIASVLAINGLSPALGQPTELAFDAAGDLFIADYAGNGRLFLARLVSRPASLPPTRRSQSKLPFSFLHHAGLFF